MGRGRRKMAHRKNSGPQEKPTPQPTSTGSKENAPADSQEAGDTTKGRAKNVILPSSKVSNKDDQKDNNEAMQEDKKEDAKIRSHPKKGTKTQSK